MYILSFLAHFSTHRTIKRVFVFECVIAGLTGSPFWGVAVQVAVHAGCRAAALRLHTHGSRRVCSAAGRRGGSVHWLAVVNPGLGLVSFGARRDHTLWSATRSGTGDPKSCKCRWGCASFLLLEPEPNDFLLSGFCFGIFFSEEFRVAQRSSAWSVRVREEAKRSVETLWIRFVIRVTFSECLHARHSLPEWLEEGGREERHKEGGRMEGGRYGGGVASNAIH